MSIIAVAENKVEVMSKAQEALQMMKKLEKKKRKDLVSVRIDAQTVVTTTKDRMEVLLEDLGYPGLWKKPKRGRPATKKEHSNNSKGLE